MCELCSDGIQDNEQNENVHLWWTLSGIQRTKVLCTKQRLEFLPRRLCNLLDLAVGFPTVEDHADGVVLDRLTFARTEFDEVGRRELVR